MPLDRTVLCDGTGVDGNVTFLTYEQPVLFVVVEKVEKGRAIHGDVARVPSILTFRLLACGWGRSNGLLNKSRVSTR